MKKKVLFVCYGLGIGGIEKCLINLLNRMDKDFYDIDLLLMTPDTSLLNQIHTRITLLDSYKYVMDPQSSKSQIKKRETGLKKYYKYFKYLCFRIRVKLGYRAWDSFKPLKKKYDIAIAYSQNDYSPYYVIDKVKASKKVMWYHNGAYDRPARKFKRDKKYYNKFNTVVAVSTDCKKMLQKTFHFQPGKIEVLRNFYDYKEIRRKATEFQPSSFSDKQFCHITTVGRLTSEKGADLAVEACERLVKHGYNICWHWVGDGNQREIIEKQISEKNLQNHFILEGNQLNPYPFINEADLYVQPSYYEAYSTTIVEARVLYKPIVTTDVGGMRDQLKDGVTGCIVNIDARSIADKISDIIDENLMIELSTNLQNTLESQEKNMRQYEKTVFK